MRRDCIGRGRRWTRSAGTCRRCGPSSGGNACCARSARASNAARDRPPPRTAPRRSQRTTFSVTTIPRPRRTPTPPRDRGPHPITTIVARTDASGRACTRTCRRSPNRSHRVAERTEKKPCSARRADHHRSDGSRQALFVLSEMRRAGAMSALEIGCGRGHLTLLLAGVAPDIHHRGMDLLSHARRGFPAHGGNRGAHPRHVEAARSRAMDSFFRSLARFRGGRARGTPERLLF